MRVLITGERHWKNPFLVHSMLWGLAMQSWAKGNPLILIHGAAPGVDTVVSDWVEEMQLANLEVDERPHPAHWKHTDACTPRCRKVVGRAAGPIRNKKMLTEKPQLCVAFHDDLDGESRGTKNMVKQAKAAGIPVVHIRRVH